MINKRVATLILNRNLPEVTDSLVEHITYQQGIFINSIDNNKISYFFK